MRPVAYRIFSKKHGLNLKSSGLEVLAEIVGKTFGTEWRGAQAEQLLEEACKLWKEQEMGLFVEGAPLRNIISEIVQAKKSASSGAKGEGPGTVQEVAGSDGGSDSELDDAPSFDPNDPMDDLPATPAVEVSWKEYFRVIGAFEQPLLDYNSREQRFEKRTEKKPTLFSTAKSATDMFMTRYNLIHDRLMRNDELMSGSKLKITSIRSLIGREGDFSIFGILCKNPEGKYCLQDNTGRIALFMAEGCAPNDTVYYPEGCFVICDGRYIMAGMEVFMVVSMGPPVPERRKATREAYGMVDYLGLHGAPTGAALKRIDRHLESQLAKVESTLTDHKIIIFGGDMHLDSPITLRAIRKVLSTLEAEFGSKKPLSLVFTGNYSSQYLPPHLYKQGFDNLTDIFKDFSSLIEGTRILFIPGQRDPWTNTFPTDNAVMPLQPLPSTMINRILRLCGENVSVTSNPCRMAYLTQEFVFFRDQLSSRLRKCNVTLEGGGDVLDGDNLPTQATQGATQMTQATQQGTQMSDEGNETIDSDFPPFLSQLSNFSGPGTFADHTESAYGPDSSLSAKEIEARRLARTICDQAHLAPFTRHERPVAWDYDQVMTLTPLPSLLCITDTEAPKFSVRYEECLVVNPGAFLNRKVAHWVEYVPAKKQVIERQLHI